MITSEIHSDFVSDHTNGSVVNLLALNFSCINYQFITLVQIHGYILIEHTHELRITNSQNTHRANVVAYPQVFSLHRILF